MKLRIDFQSRLKQCARDLTKAKAVSVDEHNNLVVTTSHSTLVLNGTEWRAYEIVDD